MEKVCIKCGQSKPPDAFYRHKKSALGVASACKECAKTYQRERRFTRKADAPTKDSKTCTRCEIEKPLGEFYPHAAYRQGVMSRCKECVKAYATDYRKQRKERQENERHDIRRWPSQGVR
jgi:hypothetical protein